MKLPDFLTNAPPPPLIVVGGNGRNILTEARSPKKISRSQQCNGRPSRTLQEQSALTMARAAASDVWNFLNRAPHNRDPRIIHVIKSPWNYSVVLHRDPNVKPPPRKDNGCLVLQRPLKILTIKDARAWAIKEFSVGHKGAREYIDTLVHQHLGWDLPLRVKKKKHGKNKEAAVVFGRVAKEKEPAVVYDQQKSSNPFRAHIPPSSYRGRDPELKFSNAHGPLSSVSVFHSLVGKRVPEALEFLSGATDREITAIPTMNPYDIGTTPPPDTAFIPHDERGIVTSAPVLNLL